MLEANTPPRSSPDTLGPGLKADWFCCPHCRGDIGLKDDELLCRSCQKQYKTLDGIPIFAPPESVGMESEERDFWEKEYRSESDGSFHAFSESTLERILDQMRIPSDGIGLDFACGSGTFGDYLDSSKVVGLDLSLALLNTSTGIMPVQGSGMILPFRTGLFDFALCAAALHHMPDPAMALREIARVLKPGGILGIVELNTSHPQRRLVTHRHSPLRRLFPTSGFSPSEQLISEKDLTGWLRNLKFKINEITYFSPQYREPSIFGRIQNLVSTLFGRGNLKRFTESYILIQATKNSQ